MTQCNIYATILLGFVSRIHLNRKDTRKVNCMTNYESFLERMARRERSQLEKKDKKAKDRLSRGQVKEQKMKERLAQEASERPEKNRLYLEGLQRAHNRSVERASSRSLLEATASGLVAESDPAVVDAIKQFGRTGRDMLRTSDKLDKFLYDPLSIIEPL